MRLARWSSLSLLLPITLGVQAPAVANSVQDKAKDTLSYMRDVYKNMYAPSEWKASFANWNVEEQLAKARQSIDANPNLTVKEARGIIRQFVYSMKDYHVSIGFNATEEASLPFMVASANNKLFIVYVDRTKLSAAAFPFSAGDELVTFGGVPAIQVVRELQAELPGNTADTDRALAARILTHRKAARGYKVPKGTILLGIKKKGSDKLTKTQLIWEYTPEQIREHAPELLKGAGITDPMASATATMPTDVFNINMGTDFSWLNTNLDTADNPHQIGGRESFLPSLGTKIWESDKKSGLFDAYIFQNKDKKLIGYVRIPTYSVHPLLFTYALGEFSKIISKFEATTEALVIDQLNNPGGAVLYLYSLASMLSSDPLVTPQHKMILTPSSVEAAYKALTALNKINSEEDLQKSHSGLSVLMGMNYKTIQFLRSYFQFKLDEWNAGRTLTSQYWIGGVDYISPSTTTYSKPILLLVNELDFSGGDFFPSILQDNKRVTILGNRTAGAGGYVESISFPNSLGIEHISVTGSIAQRADGNPIENLGVTPDIAYKITEQDLTSNYAPYVRKILQIVNKILE